MGWVNIFIGSGRFHSIAELRSFVDATYNDDGEALPPAFMREVELVNYEPMCIEVVYERQPEPLASLLKNASYANKWIAKLDGSRIAGCSNLCVCSESCASSASKFNGVSRNFRFLNASSDKYAKLPLLRISGKARWQRSSATS